jgi:DNA polymerase-1
MVIGDAPQPHDARAGEYLTGKIGQTLTQDLKSVGVSDFYYTGIVKCQPPDGRKPEPAELRACAGYLQEEIKQQKPKFVLVIGATATKAVVKSANLSSVVGKFIEKDGIVYVPCYSPAYVLRDPSKEPEYKRVLRRFGDLCQGKADLEWVEPRIRIIDRSNLDEFMGLYQSEPESVCDLETTGLDWYAKDSKVNCAGFYLPKSDSCWVLPLHKAPTLPFDAQRKLLHWMMNQNIPVTNQNWKFDSLWLWEKYQVSFYLKDDTMLMHYNLDENTPHGLKENARLWMNAPDYDLTTSEKKGNVEAIKLFTYCGRDCYRTYRLAKLFRKMMMQDSETRNIYQHLTLPAARMYEVIEREGHHVNLKRRAEVKSQLEGLMKAAEDKLNAMAGVTVNWNSPTQVGKILYGKLGMVPTVFTDKGAPSTGEAALAELDGHPVVELLNDYRSHQKMLSTYIDGWDEYMVGDKLFLGTKLHGTVTGRYSSRMHTVPRDGTIRNLIEAPEGWTFIQGDLSQAELRVIAIVSQDPELVKCYNENIDVHWRTTLGILRMGGSDADLLMARNTVAEDRGDCDGMNMMAILDHLEAMGPDAAIAIDKRWKEKRKQSKGVNFGYVYGMGATKFCEYAKLKYEWDVSHQESSDIRDGFFATYSSLPLWHDRQRSMVKIDGFVRSLSGRKRRLPGVWSPDRMVKSEAERQAINSPVQGFIGDLKVMGMLSIYNNLQAPDLGAKLRIKGEVHDSILMWVRNEHLDEMLPKIKQCMEQPEWLAQFGIELPVPIVADIEVGTWGAGKTWKGQKYNA